MTGERDPEAPLWSSRVNLDKQPRRINGGLDLRSESGPFAHNYGRRAKNSVPNDELTVLGERRRF
jgi:hypothetical protein